MPYYYNASLKKSTYTRPLPAPEVNVQAAPPPPAPLQETPPVQTQGKKTKKEKPSKKTPIEGTAWMRITTNFGNVFYTNKDRKESVWEVPREIEDQVRQLLEEENSDPRDKKRKRVPPTDPGDSGWIDVEPAKKAKEEDDDADYAAAAKAAMEEERQHSKNIMLAEQAEQREAEEERRRAYEEKKAAEAEANYDHEEAKALFKSMLMEYDINPLIPWDMALPTFVNDSRYTSLRNTEDRQDTFDEYCREKSMMAKKNAVAVDPVITYRELLRTEVTSTRTRFEDFRRDFKKDRRFFGYGRDDKEREKVFKSWLRELGEAKRKEAQKAEEAFKKLLRDTSEITTETDYKGVCFLIIETRSNENIRSNHYYLRILRTENYNRDQPRKHYSMRTRGSLLGSNLSLQRRRRNPNPSKRSHQRSSIRLLVLKLPSKPAKRTTEKKGRRLISKPKHPNLLSLVMNPNASIVLS